MVVVWAVGFLASKLWLELGSLLSYPQPPYILAGCSRGSTPNPPYLLSGRSRGTLEVDPTIPGWCRWQCRERKGWSPHCTGRWWWPPLCCQNTSWWYRPLELLGNHSPLHRQKYRNYCTAMDQSDCLILCKCTCIIIINIAIGEEGKAGVLPMASVTMTPSHSLSVTIINVKGLSWIFTCTRNLSLFVPRQK